MITFEGEDSAGADSGRLRGGMGGGTVISSELLGKLMEDTEADPVGTWKTQLSNLNFYSFQVLQLPILSMCKLNTAYKPWPKSDHCLYVNLPPLSELLWCKKKKQTNKPKTPLILSQHNGQQEKAYQSKHGFQVQKMAEKLTEDVNCKLLGKKQEQRQLCHL